MPSAASRLSNAGTNMPEDDRDERGAPNLHSLATSVAVLRSELRGFKENIGQRFDGLETTVEKALNRFVTREEHETLKGDFKDFKTNIVRLVMLILGMFVTAVGVLVFKAGLVHP